MKFSEFQDARGVIKFREVPILFFSRRIIRQLRYEASMFTRKYFLMLSIDASVSDEENA